MTDRAAKTAVGPMTIAAIEQHEPRESRIVTDELAHRMLPIGVKALVRLCAWRPLRQSMVDGLDKQATGMWASFLCRKRYLDDLVATAVDDGLERLVILGAGMDTRGLRFAGPGTTVFEVDLPVNSSAKRSRLRHIAGEVPDRFRLVPCDFETDDLAEALETAGCRLDKPTLFVWEAVTQYLTEPAVRSVFGFLDGAATGSRLAFTYVRADFLAGTHYFGGEGLHRRFVVDQRLWHFGWLPPEVDGFLREYGWHEVEQLGPARYTDRYLTPLGRDLPVSELERMVLAEKR